MQKWSNNKYSPVIIVFLLFEKFSNLCLANCLEPLRAVNDFSERDIFKWIFTSVDGGPILSSSGLPVMTERTSIDLKKIDYLFVTSSYDYTSHANKECSHAIRTLAPKSNNLIGLDTGSWLLANAGLLDGYNATIHWDVFDEFAEKFFSLTAIKERVIIDRTRITCAGAMSAFEVTRKIIEKHSSKLMALNVDSLFMRDNRYPNSNTDKNSFEANYVDRAIALMRENIENPLTLEQISKIISCSQKTLARRFHAKIQISPGQLYREIRLTLARHLLTTTHLPIYEIALRCGYDNPAALSRAYKKQFKIQPREEKKTNL
ncbi:GlxA family transcriptional regulator [Paracoccaceae bacterium]|jgi:transcriptional regulator GlxA family with amidase domain|nr:GlxA family transcriptional regulator [Paracoccaceae bacterium]